jgi:mannose PTS system EIIA component
MIGLILVTHGQLALEFRHALEHVVGAQLNIEAIPILPDDDLDARRQDIISAIQQVNMGRGVIILTDMFGGTPSNLAISCMVRGDIEVLAGINLPMLIKLVRIRDSVSIEEALLQAQEAGRKYITVASHILAKTTDNPSAQRVSA